MIFRFLEKKEKNMSETTFLRKKRKRGKRGSGKPVLCFKKTKICFT
jgi:hypothetical protein